MLLKKKIRRGRLETEISYSNKKGTYGKQIQILDPKSFNYDENIGSVVFYYWLGMDWHDPSSGYYRFKSEVNGRSFKTKNYHLNNNWIKRLHK